jgi:PAS domain S-box-containing protein
MLGKKFTDFQTPDQARHDMVVFSRLMNGETIRGHETVHISKSGNNIHMVFNAKAVRNGDGAIIGTCGTAFDITDMKQVSERLQKSEMANRSIINASPMGIYQYELMADGRLVFLGANPAADKIIGVDHSQFIGKTIEEIFPPLADTEVPSRYREAARTGAIWQTEQLDYEHGKIKGIYYVVAFGTGPNKMTAMFLDITSVKQMEMEIQKRQKLESLGILAGGIAHDFNNLMGGIFGYIDLAKESSKDPYVIDCLNKASATISRARSLTQQLLTFSKGGAPVRKVGPLFPCVKDAVEFALSGSNVSPKYDVAEDLWLCSFDSNQISQVIDNIVINALQAMPVGGSIEITARNIVVNENEDSNIVKGDYVLISIGDQGIGIPKELLSRIFDPFFTTKTKGHGLGLSTSYSILRRHGGTITVESEPGKGSIFHIYLPATKEPEAKSAIPDQPELNVKGTIIVMDDEESIRDMMKRMLSSLGYNVITFSNGEEALVELERQIKIKDAITAMILDLTIPGGMGGKELVAEIRKLYGDIPVFVASGYAEDPVMQNPAEYGFTGSICKPFMRKELVELLAKHLNSK